MRVVLVDITQTYQRPPSVGMLRHALRRRMPNIRVSAVAARWSGRSPNLFRRLGEGPDWRHPLWKTYC